MTTTTIRIDDDLKAQCETIFKEIGLPMSTAVNIFLKRVVASKGIPFNLTAEHLPNRETRKVMDEVKAGKNLSRPYRSWTSMKKDMLDD